MNAYDMATPYLGAVIKSRYGYSMPRCMDIGMVDRQVSGCADSQLPVDAHTHAQLPLHPPSACACTYSLHPHSQVPLRPHTHAQSLSLSLSLSVSPVHAHTHAWYADRRVGYAILQCV